MHFINITLIVGNAIGTRERSRVVIDATVGIKYHTEPGRQEWVTTIECVCQDATVLPPYVIFKGENLMTNWITSKNTAQWRFTCNSKGWTANEIGVDWLKLHFEALTRDKANGSGRILICDGHDSHISAVFVRHCMNNNIWILLLPPHSSHLLQPLDVGIFGPLKKAISVESDKLFRRGVARINKLRWLEGFATARAGAVRPDNIHGAWRGTGLLPFNPNRILKNLPTPTTPSPPPSDTIAPIYLLNSSPPDTSILQAARITVINKIDGSNLSPATKKSMRHFTSIAQKFQTRNSITTRENEDLRDEIGKRKERMSAKRHILKGQISICSEENAQKLETAETATKKRKAGKGLNNRGRKRQKQAQSRNTAETSEE